MLHLRFKNFALILHTFIVNFYLKNDTVFNLALAKKKKDTHCSFILIDFHPLNIEYFKI